MYQEGSKLFTEHGDQCRTCRHAATSVCPLINALILTDTRLPADGIITRKCGLYVKNLTIVGD